MKLSITIKDTTYSLESENESSDDLYHIILHFKGLLASLGHTHEKIDGCIEASANQWIENK